MQTELRAELDSTIAEIRANAMTELQSMAQQLKETFVRARVSALRRAGRLMGVPGGVQDDRVAARVAELDNENEQRIAAQQAAIEAAVAERVAYVGRMRASLPRCC